ncbi:hypothetical protein Ciccas_007021, partial [Cichlidogyrus casuarinus]
MQCLELHYYLLLTVYYEWKPEKVIDAFNVLPALMSAISFYASHEFQRELNDSRRSLDEHDRIQICRRLSSFFPSGSLYDLLNVPKELASQITKLLTEEFITKMSLTQSKSDNRTPASIKEDILFALRIGESCMSVKHSNPATTDDEIERESLVDIFGDDDDAITYCFNRIPEFIKDQVWNTLKVFLSQEMELLDTIRQVPLMKQAFQSHPDVISALELLIMQGVLEFVDYEEYFIGQLSHIIYDFNNHGFMDLFKHCFYRIILIRKLAIGFEEFNITLRHCNPKKRLKELFGSNYKHGPETWNTHLFQVLHELSVFDGVGEDTQKQLFDILDELMKYSNDEENYHRTLFRADQGPSFELVLLNNSMMITLEKIYKTESEHLEVLDSLMEIKEEVSPNLSSQLAESIFSKVPQLHRTQQTFLHQLGLLIYDLKDSSLYDVFSYLPARHSALMDYHLSLPVLKDAIQALNSRERTLLNNAVAQRESDPDRMSGCPTNDKVNAKLRGAVAEPTFREKSGERIIVKWLIPINELVMTTHQTNPHQFYSDDLNFAPDLAAGAYVTASNFYLIKNADEQCRKVRELDAQIAKLEASLGVYRNTKMDHHFLSSKEKTQFSKSRIKHIKSSIYKLQTEKLLAEPRYEMVFSRDLQRLNASGNGSSRKLNPIEYVVLVLTIGERARWERNITEFQNQWFGSGPKRDPLLFYEDTDNESSYSFGSVSSTSTARKSHFDDTRNHKISSLKRSLSRSAPKLDQRPAINMEVMGIIRKNMI